MKLILKNSQIVFEKAMEKVVYSPYETINNASVGSTGNVVVTGATSVAKLYEISNFAGNKVHVTLAKNWDGNGEGGVCVSFFESKVDSQHTTNNVITGAFGAIRLTGLDYTPNWHGLSYGYYVDSEISIPANAVSMAIISGGTDSLGDDVGNTVSAYDYE